MLVRVTLVAAALFALLGGVSALRTSARVKPRAGWLLGGAVQILSGLIAGLESYASPEPSLSLALACLLSSLLLAAGTLAAARCFSRIRGLRDQLAETDRERSLLRALVDAVPDHIFAKNTDSRFTAVNRQVTASFDKDDPRDVLGLTDMELFPEDPDSVEDFAEEQRIMASGQGIVNEERCYVQTDGSAYWLSTTKLPLRDQTGRVVGLVGINRDISPTKRAQADLAEQHNLLRCLVDSIPESIYVKDLEGRFSLVNAAVMEELGKATEELIGRTDLDIMDRDLAEGFGEGERDLLQGNAEVFRQELHALTATGHRWLRITKVPLRNTRGETIGLVGLNQDITHERESQETLRAALEAAGAANLAKSEFLANMSHEIRTPMNGVMGMTSLLLDTPLTHEQREYAETIRGSADSLLVVINDILDYSKLEAGKLELEELDFDLRETLEDVCSLLAVRAHAKGVELVYSLGTDVPSLLRGDPGRLRQVLTNLAGNAVKFTEQGEVTVHAAIESASDTRVRLRVTVTDTGIGIPEERRDRLFRSFSQVDSSTTRRFGGTGLGLAISKQLCELMGGTIGLDSSEGQGSSFWFTVSLACQPGAQETAPGLPPEARSQPVLVVDGCAAALRACVLLLESLGVACHGASSEAEAIEHLREPAPDSRPYRLVLLDPLTSGTSGHRLCAELRGNPRTASARLIALTHWGSAPVGGLRAGQDFDGRLPKPLRRSQLIECLLAGSKAIGSAADRKPAEPEAVPDEPKSRVRILLAEDNITNQKVVQRMLEKRGYRVDTVGNGREALQSHALTPYDLILMDVQMPEMDGFEATQGIRRHEEASGAHTPIIAMTAHAMKGDRELCLEAGMDDYVSKPVQPSLLVESMTRLLEARAAPV